MKLKLLLIFTYVLSFQLSFSQKELQIGESTTEDEYNYCTKGYKLQVESGLDMKQGYELEEFGEFVEGAYKFTFKILFRKEKNEFAAILVIAKSGAWNNTYYLCIPRDNSYLLKKYYAFLDAWDGSICRAYAKVLSTHLANITAVAHALEKKSKNKQK